jgi:acetyl-CoA synthetase
MFIDYQKRYQESLQNPEAFWDKAAKELITWHRPWDKVSEGNLTSGDIKWFLGANLNASSNCLDRHLALHAKKTAILWQGNEPNETRALSYQDLYDLVNRFANLLKSREINKGDRVCLYMPMIPEAIAAMLACARIGAIHSVVFGGFSPESLKNRIIDAECKAVITANDAYRGQTLLPYKANVDEALKDISCVSTVFVIKRNEHTCQWIEGRDIDALKALAEQEPYCEPEPMDADAPLFILYTSGSTGQPKGIVHTTGGYLTYAAYTFKYVFDIKPNDIYFCTADIGWITGHSYVVYGPLANASTVMIYEGTPIYPTPARIWEIIDQYQVNVFYTAPTLLRMLMQHGDSELTTSSRTSLRILGSVGEPINFEAWEWYFEKVGNKHCPIMDTWWQTETGGITMAPMVAMDQQKPGAAMRPFFGIKPALLDPELNIIEGPGEGALVIEKPWPGIMRTIYGNHQRFVDTYLKIYPGYYATGDAAKRDAEGDYWLLGRMDDVLKISGHRIGTAEVESALTLDNRVAEAAVVGYPHPIKGDGIYAFIILKLEAHADYNLEETLRKLVRKEIGPVATVDYIQFVNELPKTRSGKIMRRILRKMVEGERSHFGDLSTLADPSCINKLISDLKLQCS